MTAQIKCHSLHFQFLIFHNIIIIIIIICTFLSRHKLATSEVAPVTVSTEHREINLIAYLPLTQRTENSCPDLDLNPGHQPARPSKLCGSESALAHWATDKPKPRRQFWRSHGYPFISYGTSVQPCEALWPWPWPLESWSLNDIAKGYLWTFCNLHSWVTSPHRTPRMLTSA